MTTEWKKQINSKLVKFFLFFKNTIEVQRVKGETKIQTVSSL